MRFVGVDIAAERHVFAIMGEDGAVLARPTPFAEDAEGYAKLLRVLAGGPALVVMEATGHDWKNLFAVLVAADHAVALLNPLRSRRFQEQDLPQTRTAAIDALGLARFAREKRPAPTRLGEAATEELKELVRHRDRLKQDFDDRVRQLHRLVDLGFPEFTRSVRALDSQLATAILAGYPTAQVLGVAAPHRLAKLRYDGRHKVAVPNSPASWSRPPGARAPDRPRQAGKARPGRRVAQAPARRPQRRPPPPPVRLRGVTRSAATGRRPLARPWPAQGAPAPALTDPARAGSKNPLLHLTVSHPPSARSASPLQSPCRPSIMARGFMLVSTSRPTT